MLHIRQISLIKPQEVVGWKKLSSKTVNGYFEGFNSSYFPIYPRNIPILINDLHGKKTILIKTKPAFLKLIEV